MLCAVLKVITCQSVLSLLSQMRVHCGQDAVKMQCGYATQAITVKCCSIHTGSCGAAKWLGSSSVCRSRGHVHLQRDCRRALLHARRHPDQPWRHCHGCWSQHRSAQHLLNSSTHVALHLIDPQTVPARCTKAVQGVGGGGGGGGGLGGGRGGGESHR